MDKIFHTLTDYFVFSKPLTYAIALNELGQETVHRYVGQEPSGRMFNELILDYNSKSLPFLDFYTRLTSSDIHDSLLEF